jgi:hypothetical protein
MDIDEDKIDDTVLALLWLTLHDECRAWKGFDWDVTDRLFKKGFIDNPANKSKSRPAALGSAFPQPVYAIAGIEPLLLSSISNP